MPDVLDTVLTACTLLAPAFVIWIAWRTGWRPAWLRPRQSPPKLPPAWELNLESERVIDEILDELVDSKWDRDANHTAVGTMTQDTYRQVNDLEQAKAYIGALERENGQLQWKLIQMGQFCQRLGGRPKDAYRLEPLWPRAVLSALTITLVIAATTLALFIAATATNITGCAS